jgi:hypothetical protein
MHNGDMPLPPIASFQNAETYSSQNGLIAQNNRASARTRADARKSFAVRGVVVQKRWHYCTHARHNHVNRGARSGVDLRVGGWVAGGERFEGGLIDAILGAGAGFDGLD